MNRLALVLLCVFIAGFGGCGKDPYKLAPVSGKVMMDGKPLVDANVVFLPVTKPGSGKPGESSRGVTDKEGHYTLTCTNGIPGAAWGDHSVQISTGKFESQGDSKPMKMLKPELVPTKYHSGNTLKFTVPDEGTSAANFTDLKSDGP